MALFRLLIGILLIAGVPELARRFSARFAGIVLLIPIISITALYLTAHNIGIDTALKVSRSALIGIIPLALFFLTVNLTLKKMPVTAALATASLVWMAAASTLILTAKQ